MWMREWGGEVAQVIMYDVDWMHKSTVYEAKEKKGAGPDLHLPASQDNRPKKPSSKQSWLLVSSLWAKVVSLAAHHRVYRNGILLGTKSIEKSPKGGEDTCPVTDGAGAVARRQGSPRTVVRIPRRS